jgi:putative membrane protein
MKKTNRKFNIQILLEMACCFLFSAMMVYMVLSKQYLYFVTPRMKGYLYFVAAVMLVWGLTGVNRLFEPQHKVRLAHCFVLLLPMALLLLPLDIMNVSKISSQYVGKTGFAVTAAAQDTTATTAFVGADSAAGQSDSASEELPGLDVANKTITVDDDDFSMWVTELYVHMQQYEGYNISMTGYIFKDPKILGEGQFVPARLMMSCCVADLVPSGIVCLYSNADILKQDVWVTVEGTLTVGERTVDGFQSQEPQIKVTKIATAKEVKGYVYPYYIDG